MVKAGRFLAYSLFFVLALMYLMPKAGIYYFLEEQIRPYGIALNNEQVQERGLGLQISDASLFVQSIESAQIKAIEIDPFGLLNTVDLDEITLSSVAGALMPLHIRKVRIRHSILSPLTINVEGEGEMGSFNATFALSDRHLKLSLNPSEEMLKMYKSTLANMRRSDNGEYLYEKSI